MKIEVKHLDFLFTERFNIKKMIKDFEEWISEKKLNQDDFTFEVDKDEYSRFNMSASLKFVLNTETFLYSYKRKLNFIRTVEDSDHVEIELFKMNVLDLINSYSDHKIVKESESNKKTNFVKSYQIVNGEELITVDEKYLLENNHLIDSIFSLNSHDETPDDVKKRLKDKIANNKANV